jgi:hypothetical protein
LNWVEGEKIEFNEGVINWNFMKDGSNTEEQLAFLRDTRNW